MPGVEADGPNRVANVTSIVSHFIQPETCGESYIPVCSHNGWYRCSMGQQLPLLYPIVYSTESG